MEPVLAGQKNLAWEENFEAYRIWISQVKAHYLQEFLEHGDIERRYMYFFPIFTIIHVGKDNIISYTTQWRVVSVLQSPRGWGDQLQPDPKGRVVTDLPLPLGDCEKRYN